MRALRGLENHKNFARPWAVARIKTSRRLFDSNQSNLVWAGGGFGQAGANSAASA
jgi:hypothetical protein